MITVIGVNDPAVAMDDGYDANEDETLVINAPGVLTNDRDVEGNGLTAALVETTVNGDLSLNADGSFTYAPDLHFNGPDSFTYTVGTNIATVVITVHPVNDPPEITSRVLSSST